MDGKRSESRSVVPYSLRPHGLYRPEYWSWQPFPSSGDLPNPGIEPRSPALRASSLPAEPQGKVTTAGSLEILDYFIPRQWQKVSPEGWHPTPVCSQYWLFPCFGERILGKSIQQRNNPQPAVLKMEGKLEHPALPGSLFSPQSGLLVGRPWREACSSVIPGELSSCRKIYQFTAQWIKAVSCLQLLGFTVVETLLWQVPRSQEVMGTRVKSGWLMWVTTKWRNSWQEYL